jgi:hypothetical protein
LSWDAEGATRQLGEEFLQLAVQRERNAAGLALERMLNRLFEMSGPQPRQPFRVVGEQNDGSFQLVSDGWENLSAESKWEKEPLPEAKLRQ